MRHTPAGGTHWSPAPAENFIGEVWFGALSSAPDAAGLQVLGVQFAPGARTNWHSHPGGQVLYVVSGAGIVANEAGDRVEIATGDTVTIPPGEAHWHGSREKTPMLHLSLTVGGETQWLDRTVSTDEYRA